MSSFAAAHTSVAARLSSLKPDESPAPISTHLFTLDAMDQKLSSLDAGVARQHESDLSPSPASTAFSGKSASPSPATESSERGSVDDKSVRSQSARLPKRARAEFWVEVPARNKRYAPSPSVKPQAMQAGVVPQDQDDVDVKPHIKPDLGAPVIAGPLYPATERPEFDSELGGSILNIEIFANSFFATFPPSQNPVDLLSLKHFHRTDLGGPPIWTHIDHPTKARPLPNSRLTLDPKRDYGLTHPGEPFYWFAGGARAQVDTAVFVSNKKAKRLDSSPSWPYKNEVWKYFGTYRCLWSAGLNQADWDTVRPEAQDTLVGCFEAYGHSEKNRTHMRGWGFAKESIVGDKVDRMVSIRRELEDHAEQCSPIWGLYVYCGYDQEELNWVSGRRATRRASA